jgi:uncharacterized protein YodC (DUF2158 family)
MKFKIRDVVRLKSGGVTMKVEGYDDREDYYKVRYSPETKGKWVECKWFFDNKEVGEETFHENMLEKVEQ